MRSYLVYEIIYTLNGSVDFLQKFTHVTGSTTSLLPTKDI